MSDIKRVLNNMRLEISALLSAARISYQIAILPCGLDLIVEDCVFSTQENERGIFIRCIKCPKGRLPFAERIEGILEQFIDN